MHGYVFQNINGRSRGNTLKILLFLLNEICTGTHSQDSCGKDSSKKHWWNLPGKNKLGMLVRSWTTKVILIGPCGWHQNGRKEAEFSLCERNWWKTLTLRSQHHFLITFTLDAPNGNTNPTRKSLDNTTKCLNFVFLLEQPKNYQDGTNLAQKLQRGLTTWKDMLDNARNGIAYWQTKRLSNCSEFLMLVWTITKSKGRIGKQRWIVRSLRPHCIKKCLYLARIGRPDILWSVNKLARSVTKWTQAWDKRLARLISFIHFTRDYRQYCHVGNAAQHCRLGLFQDSDFAGDLEDLKPTSGGVLWFFGSRRLVPISWMC